MSGPILDAPRIHELIRDLSLKHILRNSPQTYIDGFVKAALEVYDPAARQKTLQQKFHIPDESNYSDEVYYQGASELSVSYYLKQKEKQRQVTNFELEKKLNFNPNDNPPNLKDVDNFFHVGPTRVFIEVKCPQEEKQAAFPGTITLKSAGRLPDPKQIDRMRDKLESRSTAASGTKFTKGKNPDLRMKDCLESANGKFNSKSGVDDLNVLFLSCGRYDKMNEWYNCLYGTQGLFTGHSFAPEATCPKVDLVIISTLRYRHEYARAYPAWTLDDVLLLPVANPHRRSSCTTEAIEKGLSVFNHYLKDFALFEPSRLVWNQHSETQLNIQKTLKINYFVMEYLKSGEFSRFFPTIDKAKAFEAPIS